MIRVKLARVLQAKEPLERLFNSQKLELSTSYRLIRLLRQLEEIIESFELVRIKSVQKYGAKNELGSIQVPPERLWEFEKDMKAVLSELVQIEPEKVDMLELEKVGFSTLELSKLIDFIEPSMS